MSGVEDLVGNVLYRPVVWEVMIEKSESLSFKATLEGVVLNTPYLVQYADMSSQEFTNFTTMIIRDIATLLKIPVTFLSLVVTNSSRGLASVTISITSLATSERSSIDLVNELRYIIQSQDRSNSRRRNSAIASSSFINMTIPFTDENMVRDEQ